MSSGRVKVGLACAYCRGEGARDALVFCASCLAPHHPDCFSGHGRCSVHGCGGRLTVQPVLARPMAAQEAPAQPRASSGWFGSWLGTSTRQLALFGLVLFLCTLSAWCIGRTAVTRRDLHLAKANSSLRLEVESLQREVEEREWRLTQGPPPPHMLGWTKTGGATVPFSNGKLSSQGVVNQWGDRYLLIGSSAIPEGGEIQELGADIWQVTGIRTSSSVELTNLRDGSVKVLYTK